MGKYLHDLNSEWVDHAECMDACFKGFAKIIRRERDLVKRGIVDAQNAARFSAEGSPLFFVYTLIADKINYIILPLTDGTNYFEEYRFSNRVLSGLHFKALVELLKMLKPQSADYAKHKDELSRVHNYDFETKSIVRRKEY